MDNISSSFCRVPLCSHLLQQCLRSFCIDSQSWVYAVFWRILPRNFPPPRWEIGGYLDRTKASKRNWILVWEDGFCDFARATISGGSFGLQPDLFFKMSHEVYNYGEGLMGKVSSDNGHKWVYKDPSQPGNAPSWQTSIDPHPRTWEAQFKSGIKTILVIAVREGLVQLGSSQRIQEDFNFVVLLQRKFNNLLITLPSSLLSSPPSPVARMGRENKSETDHAPANSQRNLERQLSWNGPVVINEACQRPSKPNDINNPQTTLIPHLRGGDYHATIMPSMNSLQALLSKLPSVTSCPQTTQISTLPNQHIRTDNSTSNGNFSLGCHASPLIRSLSAPHGDYWLQEPTNPSATPSIASPSEGLLVNSTDQQHHQQQQQQQSLSNAFVAVDSGANVGDYTYLGDLMGG